MKKKHITVQSKDLARERLLKHGERVTPTRVAALAVLLDAHNALSHLEIAELMHSTGEPSDRVTLYRVLDWLVEHDLAHKVAGEDRVWRFTTTTNQQHPHPHFHCIDCGKVMCLDAVHINSPRLPTGFTLAHMDTTIQGSCPDCNR